MRRHQILAVLAVVGLGLPLLSPAWCAWASFALAQGLAALGIAILLRAGQISFGHAFYFAMGGYVVAFASRSVTDAFLLAVTGAIAAGLMAAVLASFITRYRGIFFAMLNLSISMLAYTLLQKAYDFAGGSDGLRVAQATFGGQSLGPADHSVALYLLTAMILLFVVGIISRYMVSPMGEALSALKTSETRLDYLGISPNQLLGVTYVLSAVLAGLGGAISALNTGIVTPELAYWTRSAEFVFIAVLGGVGHVVGPLLGAVVFESVKSAAASVLGDVWDVALGIVLFVIVLYAPAGIVSLGRMRRAN